LENDNLKNGMNIPCVHWLDCACLVRKRCALVTTKKEFTYS